jgi:CHAT domain-containing protein
MERDAPPNAGLVEDLTVLAAGLLPPEVLRSLRSEISPLFFVTADGFIGRIPFEALNIGNASEYKPLLSSFDVGYIRHLRKTTANLPAKPGLIVANTSTGRPGRDVCSAPLTKVISEVEKVAGRFPGSEVLVNASATKANVVSLWQEASFLYLATHLLEDPDVPYMSLVPLAPADNSAVSANSCLDMADIRAADFSRCNAVVLNQCSSGKPYLGARNSSPGLASAFLDSGAGTVVQTLWNVRDDYAGAFMPSIISDLESSSLELVRALCRAKRARMISESGIRHPFLWAPYTIQLGRL